MADSDVQLNIKPLEKLLKAMKVAGYAQVGIIGQGGAREDGLTNAFVGAMHEFGTSTMVQRSWLRMPLNEHFMEYLNRSGLLDKKTLAQVMKDGTFKAWLEQCAIVAERVIADGFATAGFGKWQPWASPGYTNNTGMILVDSQQLRDSVTSKVVIKASA